MEKRMELFLRKPVGIQIGSNNLSPSSNMQHRLLPPWHIEAMFKDVLGRNKDFNHLHYQNFTKDLQFFLHWMEEIRKEVNGWIKPGDNLLCLRIQLEKHLTFAIQSERHQPEKDLLVQQAREISDAIPSLLPYLEEILSMIDIQWEELHSQIDRQYQEIESALESIDYVTGNLDQVTSPAQAEYNKDTKDQLSMRLHCGKRKSSPMQISISGHNRQMECFNNGLEMTGSSSSNSSDAGFFEDFEKEYHELVDWLSEVQLVLTDNESQTFTSKERLNDLYKATEVNKQEEFRPEEPQHLLSVYPNLTSEITNKLTDLNHKWNYNMSQTGASDCHGNRQSVMLGELEEILVALRMWLNDVERRLFTGQRVKHSMDVEEIEKRLQEHQDLQEDIEKHARSVTSLLTLCNLLQDDSRACPSERDSDTLQLAAINLDRRWQAILIQSIDFQCKLEEKLYVLKGPLYNPGQDVAAEARPEPVTSSQQSCDVASPNSRSVNASSDQPGAKMIEGLLDYGYQREAVGAPGPELVPVRKAFSENDAFSISDISDISLDDLTFDDMYQLKEHEEAASVASGNDLTLLHPDMLDLGGDLPFEAYLSNGPASPPCDAFMDFESMRRARELAAKRQRKTRKGRDRPGSCGEVEGQLGHCGSSPDLHVVHDGGGVSTKRKLPEECLRQEDTLDGKKQAQSLPFFSDNFEEIFDIEDIDFVEFSDYQSVATLDAGRPKSGLSAQIVGAEAEFPDSFNAVTDAVDQAILQLGSSPKDDSDLHQLMATYIDPDISLDGHVGSRRVASSWKDTGTGSEFKQLTYSHSLEIFDSWRKSGVKSDFSYSDSNTDLNSLKNRDRGLSEFQLESISPTGSMEGSSDGSSGTHTSGSVIYNPTVSINTETLFEPPSRNPPDQQRERFSVEDSHSGPRSLLDNDKEQFKIRKPAHLPSLYPAKLKSSRKVCKISTPSAISLDEPDPLVVSGIPANSIGFLQSTPQKKEGQPLSCPSPSTPAMWSLLQTPDKQLSGDHLPKVGHESCSLSPLSAEIWSLTATPNLRVAKDISFSDSDDYSVQLALPLDISGGCKNDSFSPCLNTREMVEIVSSSTLHSEDNSKFALLSDVNFGRDSIEKSRSSNNRFVFYSNLSEIVDSCLNCDEKGKLANTNELVQIQKANSYDFCTMFEDQAENLVTTMAGEQVEAGFEDQEYFDSVFHQDCDLISPSFCQDWDLPELTEAYLDLPFPPRARDIDMNILDQKNNKAVIALDETDTAGNLDALNPSVNSSQLSQQDTSEKTQVSKGVYQRDTIGERPLENVSVKNVHVSIDDKDTGIDTKVSVRRAHVDHVPTTGAVRREGETLGSSVKSTPYSFLYRVLCIAIPMQLLLTLFLLVVVVLPVVVEQSNGDCSLSFDDLYLNKLLIEPVLRYVSGRPPL